MPRQQELPKKVPDAPTLDDLGRPAENVTLSQEMPDQGIAVIFHEYVCLSMK